MRTREFTTMLCGMAGAGLPLAILLVLQLFRDSIQTENDLKEALPGQPILGVINHQPSSGIQLFSAQHKNLVTERFRTLRTNLQYYDRKDTKCIMVTSSTSNEGKTFVAANLARSFAMSRKKTVVIDFDLRKPDMGGYFEENPEDGLSNFLTGEIDLPDIIQVSGKQYVVFKLQVSNLLSQRLLRRSRTDNHQFYTASAIP